MPRVLVLRRAERREALGLSDHRGHQVDAAASDCRGPGAEARTPAGRSSTRLVLRVKPEAGRRRVAALRVAAARREPSRDTFAHAMRLPPELSVEIIRGSQTATGAYPASPAHEVYRYGWLRDGSWCAQAMDRAGHRASAGAWHRWVAEVLLRHERRGGVDPARCVIGLRQRRPGRQSTRRGAAQLDRGNRDCRWIPPRTGHGQRPITAHAALLAAAMGSDGVPAVVVTRDAPDPA